MLKHDVVWQVIWRRGFTEPVRTEMYLRRDQAADRLSHIQENYDALGVVGASCNLNMLLSPDLRPAVWKTLELEARMWAAGGEEIKKVVARKVQENGNG